MQSSTLQNLLGRLRRWTDPARPKDLSDAELLERFRVCREEAAFALLVQRHGPMVLAVCRRILGSVHDADDAFQAAFLALARNAAAIRKQQSLAGWLHVTATRIAHKARTKSMKQRTRLRELPPPHPRPDPSELLAGRELRAVLDDEIARLPDKYRTPFVLCYLADKTHEQIAGELGWPKSSVTARLARARQLLQHRLTRRGFTVSAGALTVALTESAANAAVPNLLTLSAVRVAAQSVGQTPLAVAALADAAVKGVMLPKWTAALLLLAALGVATVAGHRLSGGGSPSPREKPQPLAARREAKPQPREPRLDLFGDPLPNEALARLGSSRLRHPGIVRTLAFSPDGKSIVTSGDGLRIWDAKTGKSLHRFDFGQTINGVVFRHTAEGIVCPIVDDKWNVTVRVVDPATGKVRRQLRIDEKTPVLNPTLSPDGKHLAVARKNDVQLFDATTGARGIRIPFKGIAAWKIAFTPDSKIIAFNDLSTGNIFLHDAASGKLVRELKQASATTLHLVFSPDGRFLAAMPQNRLAEKGEVSIWNWREGKEVHRLTHSFPRAVSAAFSPDGKRVAIGGGPWGMMLWNTETGKEIRRLSPQGGVTEIAFSPDGKTLATASLRGIIRLWDAASGKNVPPSADPDVADVRHLRFSPNGKRLFGDAGAGFIWDAASGRELRRFTDPETVDFNFLNYGRWLALSPDETRLAANNRDYSISLWDAATGKERHRLKGHTQFIYDILFAPDSQRLLSNSVDGTVRVWDVKSGRELHKLPGLAPLAVSPDGRLLAVRIGTTPGISLYELANGRETRRLSLAEQGNIFALAFSPDSRRLAATGTPRRGGRTGIAKVWEVSDGRLLRSLDSPKSMLLNVAFAPDGRSVATGDSFGSLKLWELASGRPRHTFTGHQSYIGSLAFSPDGQTLAAFSADAPILVWDVAGVLEPRPRRLSKDEIQRAWNALAGEDATAAFQAIRRLAAAPAQTLPLLREHLKPVPAPDRKRVRQWIKTLDSDEFKERQKAVAELKKAADAAASTLRQMADDKASLYVRRTLQQILDAQENSPEALRAVRAVEVLEWIATPEAIRLLDELAKGTADARLTREAAASRKRLRRE